MKILVTGGAGFIGSHIVDLYLARGYEVVVVAIFTGQMLADQPVVINGDGEQVRDFAYVGDCARANLLALTHAPDHAIYNLGSGQGTSVNEIFAALQRITDYGRTPLHGPAKVGEMRRIYLDATKAGQQLGWAPEVTLEEGLAMTVEYFQTTEVVAADMPQFANSTVSSN